MHELTARQPKRVLLVEDDPEFARMTQMMLEKTVSDVQAGDEHQNACICGEWVVFCVSSLSAATDALHMNEHQFDVIILDMILPDGEREDAVRIIRAAAPDLPIVVQSAITDFELVSTLLQKGAISDYLVKGNFNSSASLKQAICHAIDVFHTARAGQEFMRRMAARASAAKPAQNPIGDRPAAVPDYSGQGL